MTSSHISSVGGEGDRDEAGMGAHIRPLNLGCEQLLQVKVGLKK